MVFAILLILPATILGALHLVDIKVIPLMLSPSGTLLGVVSAYASYVSRKRGGICCACCGLAQHQPEHTSTHPTLIVNPQPDMSIHQDFSADDAAADEVASTEIEHKETKALLNNE